MRYANYFCTANQSHGIIPVVQVKITGEPLPDVTWEMDGKPLKGQRIKTSTERGKHIFKVSD